MMRLFVVLLLVTLAEGEMMGAAHRARTFHVHVTPSEYCITITNVPGGTSVLV
jgi:hypothetical protein